MVPIKKEYYDEKLKEMPRDVLEAAVKYFKDNMPEEVKQECKQLFAEKGEIEWAITLHHFWGMNMRNKLRSETNLLDDRLPDGNWDDYYIQVIEVACGLRDIPEVL